MESRPAAVPTLIVVKHARTRSTQPIDAMFPVADAPGDLGPPAARSAAAKLESGVTPREERDDDVQLVDESDLLDEMGFAAEQAIAHGAQPGGAKLTLRRPRAPNLPEKGPRLATPAEEALLRVEDHAPVAQVRPERTASSVPPPLPTRPGDASAASSPLPSAAATIAADAASAATTEPEAPIELDESDVTTDEPEAASPPVEPAPLGSATDAPKSEATSPSARPAPEMVPPPTLQAIANAQPVKPLPPPPRPLPPTPTPTPSLRAHVEPLASEPTRESRRRKRERAAVGNAAAIGAPRPAPAPSGAKQRSSLGWVAAVVLVGAGAYAAGTLGARGELRGEPGTRGERAPSALGIAEPDAAESRATRQGEMRDEEIASRASGDASERDASQRTAASQSSPSERATDGAAVSSTDPEVTKATAAETSQGVQPAPDAASTPSPVRAAAPGARAARMAPEISPAPAPAPVAGLDTNAASATLARAGAKAASCTDPRGGDGAVSVTFLPSGNPANVKMSGPYAGTAVASCVEQIFRGTRVASFEGTPTTVYYTVRLPGDGKPIN